ncbi:MAG: nitrite/sulfite reductase [Desulfuromusa sp.]|nr:nitrite/sulfite reductase [Desulfuromusa sp.]
MKTLEQSYLNLKDNVDKYLAGDISATDLKKVCSLLGIYQQRNGLFMLRIRITGGHISVSKLQKVADIMDEYNVGFAHITTRQTLQLQDVAAADIDPILKKLTANGMPFRGGGSNTYRNILASSDSAVATDETFDVLPYAQALNDFLFTYDKAIELPRKIKFGFSSGGDDSIKAIVQDLGFIAKQQNGEKGFEVYAGGGMGKESILGVKVFDFLPENQFAKCAKAVTDLFYDHGDRTNRSQARLRFVHKRLGKDKFIELFQEYFKKSTVAVKVTANQDIEGEVKSLQQFEFNIPDDKHYRQWTAYATCSTKFGDDIISLRLFVPYGNLKANQIREIADLAEKCGLSFVRLTQSMDILFPLIHKSVLPVIFASFNNELRDLDLSLLSFRGHLTACIGPKVCVIGIADAPALSDMIAAALDEYFTEYPDKKPKEVLSILQELKISGCPNTCSGHIVSKIGLQGMKKRVNEVLTEGAFLYTGGNADQDDACLASSEKEFFPKNQIARAVRIGENSRSLPL